MKKLLVLFLFILINKIYCNTVEYIVKYGDTLYGIALAHGISANDIIYDNSLINTSIKENQKLIITKLDIDEYRVQKNESISSLSKKLGLTEKHLRQINKFSNDYYLSEGEIIKKPISAQEKKNHIVGKGESLSWISMAYTVTIEDLTRINNLKNNDLKIGQQILLIDEKSIQMREKEVKLASISIPENEKKIKENKKNNIESIKYTVKKGDTLSQIALEYHTTVDDIIKNNNLKSSSIFFDQVLDLPEYAKKRGEIDYYIYHTVVRGDTISGISYNYDISETLLRELNNLESDTIKIGQQIKLIPPVDRIHTVKNGDTLWSIAQKYNVSLDQLLQYNNLNSTQVLLGQKINIYDYKIASHTITAQDINKKTRQKISNIELASLEYHRDYNSIQPFQHYRENGLLNSLTKYNQGVELLNKFNMRIEATTQISNVLKGWTIIIDPGHGGKDPGAIASLKTQDGKNIYIVEDEYAYDVSLRLYELFIRNGAEVHLTVLSPNHLTRNPDNKFNTFINEQNEVYNSAALNKINNITIWPVGGQWGLDQRVTITNNFIKGKPTNKTIFISVHADNDSSRGLEKLILFHSDGIKEDDTSRDFAKHVVSKMDINGIVKGMNLGVLRGNNAKYKVLVEVRNMMHLSDALSILDKDTRQEDAKDIVEGIKNYITRNY